MKYKVGNRVKVKSLQWYNENHNDDYDVVFADGWHFTKTMSKFCGKELIIEEISYAVNPPYYMMRDNIFAWTDEMIEGLVEEEVDLIPKFGEYSDNEPLDIPTMTTDFIKEHGFSCPNGYQFVDENGNVINSTKIVLEKKKKEYPKTYEECCKVFDIDDRELVFNGEYRASKLYWKQLGKLNVLNQILICRDTYWKIAGEEMGLGKPWKPDWSIYEHKFCLGTNKDTVIEECVTTGNRILAFPTEEMRDAFYENFKKKIEECKELL